jgi:hypothetical protein
VLLDGGSQHFCFETVEGQRLTVVLNNKLDDASPLTFSIESDDSGTVVLGRSSNEEAEVLAIMGRWVTSNYSADEMDELRLRLDALMEDGSSAPALTEDEQTALLISDLPQLLATRPAAE